MIFARREFGTLAQAFHAALLHVEADGADVDHVLAVAGQKRFDAVDEFLRGEGQGKDRVGDFLFHFHFRREDEDDGEFGIFFAQRLADAHPTASQRRGIDHGQMRRDLFEPFGGFSAALHDHDFKSLLLQIGSKGRDFGMTAFD